MKRERGQAFILVLILLALGALLITPLLQLTSSTLKSSTMYRQFANEDYAADAAIEYGMWRLNWEPGFAASLPAGNTSAPFYITLNGVTAWATITAQATSGEQLSGQPLMKDGVSYRVIKQVSPDTANVSEETVFTYTVDFKCYELAAKDIEEIIDQLPLGLEYVPDSTDWDEEQWRNIDGDMIEPFDPEERLNENGYELKWKFSKDYGKVAFDYGEVKWMTFQARGTLDVGIYGNDIWVKTGDKGERNMGAYQAPITVGEPGYNSVPSGFVDIKKKGEPLIIYPNQVTTVTYTVTVENVDVVSVIIKYIEDWLPSTGSDQKDTDEVFRYVPNSTTANITDIEQNVTEVPLPDDYPDTKEDILEEKWKDGKTLAYRWSLKWKLENHEDARFDPIILKSGEVLTMVFQATVNPEASGAYLNEFLLECIRYPLDVVTDPEFKGTSWPSPGPNTVRMTVTMENIDVEEWTIKKLKAWLPGPSTGNVDDAFIYSDNLTAYIDGDEIDTVQWELKEDKWEGRKERWKVKWDKVDELLEPGEVLTIEFDTTVTPSEPQITYNELYWEAELKDERDNHRRIYSFPTAGVTVPMYDLNAGTLSSILATNAWLGRGNKIEPHSEHWEKHR